MGDKAISANGEIPVNINPPEIRKEIFDFATTNFFDSEESGVKVWAINQCDILGNCKNDIEATNPVYAWSILFLAQAMVEYRDSDSGRYKVSEKLLTPFVELKVNNCCAQLFTKKLPVVVLKGTVKAIGKGISFLMGQTVDSRPAPVTQVKGVTLVPLVQIPL